jgi:hypothetical protein
VWLEIVKPLKYGFCSGDLGTRFVQLAPRHGLDVDLAFMLAGPCEVVGYLSRSHVSAPPPKALSRRIAISAEIPLLPLTILLSVCRVTPARTEIARHSLTGALRRWMPNALAVYLVAIATVLSVSVRTTMTGWPSEGDAVRARAPDRGQSLDRQPLVPIEAARDTVRCRIRTLKPVPETQIAQAVQLLDLMLEHFADDGRWTRGRYDDGNGGHCLVGALLHLSREHRLPRAPAIALLQDAMPRPGLPLVHFNDACCGTAAELRSIILKARRLADDHAEQDRAAAAAKAWMLARIGKRRTPSTDIVDAAPNKPFVPERLAA